MVVSAGVPPSREPRTRLGEKIVATLTTWAKIVVDFLLKAMFYPVWEFIKFITGQFDKLMQVGSYPGKRASMALKYNQDVVKAVLADMEKMSPPSRFIFGTAFSVGFMINMMKDMLVVGGIRARQYLLRKITPVEPDPNILARADILGNITRGEGADRAKSSGYGSREYDIIKQAMKAPAPLSQVRDASLRGIISSSTAGAWLSYLGFDNKVIPVLKKLFYYIPPPPDLIRMAVKEAFTPAIYKRFGQDQDFPAEFAKFAKQQGISTDWARKYWIAHWDLPSTMQGFEMLHRGVISEGDLKTLLRALDVMPFWRDKLIKISYRPYTRVDVRRMYKMGVLNRAQVKKSYLDLGYDSEKAEKMTQFTVAWSAGGEKELTKSDVLDGLKRKLLTQAQTKAMLSAIGYESGEIDFYIKRTLQKAAEEKKKALVSAVKTRFEKGLIDENEVVQRLSSENLPASEIQEYISLWSLTRGKQVFVPPVGDLKAWFAKGIIGTEEFKQEMINRGCSMKYIRYYISQLGGGG